MRNHILHLQVNIIDFCLQKSNVIDHQLEYNKTFADQSNYTRQTVKVCRKRSTADLLIFVTQSWIMEIQGKSKVIALAIPWRFTVNYKLLLLIFQILLIGVWLPHKLLATAI